MARIRERVSESIHEVEERASGAAAKAEGAAKQTLALVKEKARMALAESAVPSPASLAQSARADPGLDPYACGDSDHSHERDGGAMTLLAPWGSEVRLWTAGIFALLAFGTPVAGASGVWVFGLSFLVFLLSHASGSSASWATVDSREIVAHYTFRPSVNIPLANIAAVSVRERRMFTRASVLPQPLSFISIFRKDVPGLVEICAPSGKAEPFLAELARNARRAGASDLASFSIPRPHYGRDMVPLVPALVIVLMFPFPVSWSAFALAGFVLLLQSALAWHRFAKLAREIARGVVHPELAWWATQVKRAELGRAPIAEGAPRMVGPRAADL